MSGLLTPISNRVMDCPAAPLRKRTTSNDAVNPRMNGTNLMYRFAAEPPEPKIYYMVSVSAAGHHTAAGIFQDEVQANKFAADLSLKQPGAIVTVSGSSCGGDAAAPPYNYVVSVTAAGLNFVQNVAISQDRNRAMQHARNISENKPGAIVKVTKRSIDIPIEFIEWI